MGATSGLTGDAVMASLDSDFVDSVTQEMRPGMTALIVEADEKSTRPVDDIVKLKGGQSRRLAPLIAVVERFVEIDGPPRPDCCRSNYSRRSSQ